MKSLLKRIPVISQLIQIRNYVARIIATLNDVATRLNEANDHLRSLRLLETEALKRQHLEDLRFDPKRLVHHEHSVFSQNGEDGILQEIFQRIGSSSRYFVEIGVGDGLENNTVLLLQRGWSGCWIDGSEEFVSSIRKRFTDEVSDGRLVIQHAFIDAHNLMFHLSSCLEVEIDLLSIDIDRNTYWVWKAMESIRPRVVVVEYNSTYPASQEFVVSNDTQKNWDGTMYFGASLKSFEILGRSMDYSLVGCDATGTNAFFVRSDLCGELFSEPFTAENHFTPAGYFMSMRAAHPRQFSD